MGARSKLLPLLWRYGPAIAACAVTAAVASTATYLVTQKVHDQELRELEKAFARSRTHSDSLRRILEQEQETGANWHRMASALEDEAVELRGALKAAETRTAEVRSEVEEERQLRARLQAANQQLERQVTRFERELSQLLEEAAAEEPVIETSAAPPGREAQILSITHDAVALALDQGSRMGHAVGDRIVLSIGNEQIARVRVTHTTRNTSVCAVDEFLGDAKRLHQGQKVLILTN